MTDPWYLQDFGLGLCVQCVAEHKMEVVTNGMPPDKWRPRNACTMVQPFGNLPFALPICYEHLEVKPAEPPPQQRRIQPVTLPSGQTILGPPRHAR